MKVLVFAFDSADYELVKEFRDDLDTLPELIDRGLSGPLETVYPPSTRPGWSAFSMGKNSGKTNVMHWGKSMNPGTYEVNKEGNELVRGRKLWEYLTDEGLTSVVHNVPTTFPPREVDGCVVSGFDLPSDDVCWTYPEELKEELVERFGYSPTEPGTMKELGPDRYLIEFVKHHRGVLQGGKYLMEKFDWDLFVSGFTAVDRVAHNFMQCREDNGAYLARGDPIKRMYKMADRYFTALLQLANKKVKREGEELAVVVLSDHGTRQVNRRFNLNTILLRNGFIELSEEGRKEMEYGGTSEVSEMHKFFNWNETEAWVCPDMLGGGSIYLNDERFPNPEVRDRERVIQELKEVLENLTVPGTNVSPIRKVVEKGEVFNGPYLKDFPDLICFPGDGWAWDPNVLRSNSFMKGNRGEHSMYGHFSITGPGVEPGEREEHILNVFPTILDLLDLPVPGDVDGESMLGKTEERDPLPSRERREAGESDRLREQLKDLGYL